MSPSTRRTFLSAMIGGALGAPARTADAERVQVVRLSMRWGGMVFVRAYVSGLLAIHPAWNLDGTFSGTDFAITHLPTGYAVWNRLSLDEAREAVRELVALNWNFTSQGDPVWKATEGAFIRIKDRLYGKWEGPGGPDGILL